VREELRVQRLLSGDEAARVLAREKGRLLVMAAGKRPAILKRAIYYADKPFEGLWDS
jgi:type IV secretory pathway TraG/TraD family ATPase VirD4